MRPSGGNLGWADVPEVRPARVTLVGSLHRVTGEAWGAPIDRVEVRIDDGPWQPATLDGEDEAEFAWTIWSIDWADATPGEHTVTAQAIDTAGNIQPAINDPVIANKRTYWESRSLLRPSRVAPALRNPRVRVRSWPPPETAFSLCGRFRRNEGKLVGQAIVPGRRIRSSSVAVASDMISRTISAAGWVRLIRATDWPAHMESASMSPVASGPGV